MSKIVLKSRVLLRFLAGTLGVVLFAYLVRRAGPAQLLHCMKTLGWGVVLVMAWGGVAHFLKTWAWRLTLLDEKRRVSFARMFGLRLASESVGQFGGVAQMFGEGLRVSMLGPDMPLANGIASVTLDRAFFVLSAAVVSLIGLIAVLIVLPLPHALALYAELFAFVFLAVLCLSALAVMKRWPLLSVPARSLGRVRYFKSWIEGKLALVESVERNLLDFCHHTPRAFWASFSLNLACHAAAVVEVYLILSLLNSKVSLFGALAVEALTKLVNIAGTFNPGNVGTYEGGTMLIAKIFGLTAATGLALAFTRRMRALFWAAVGGLCIAFLSKKRRDGSSTSNERNVMHLEPISETAVRAGSTLVQHSHTVVILANRMAGISFGSPLPKVGTLPILLRTILGAHKGGAARIVVVTVRGSGIRREMLRTGRLPQTVEWYELSPEGGSILSLIGQLALETKGHLVVTAGDRVYQPSLQRRAAEWNRQGDALALMTDTELVGICTLSSEAAGELATQCASGDASIEEMYDCLSWTYPVEREQVSEDKWQQILTEQQRRVAEQKLDRWLVKPTDGIYARFNRRISIPISRQLIQFPITPNMVSLFTLGVSFTGGVFFALGGYWHMLMGAVLSWFSSVLDGSDGEVARLKLQESAFGTWLETICDNLYYLFTFAGMTIGLVRTTGNRSYLIWGGLLAFGAIASFVATGLQRHQLAGARPEQYLGVWHKKAESRSSNPFLFLGRHTEFIIRRCFLPYAFLVFALFNAVNWALVGAAIGANVVWMIAFYSYFTFATPRTSTVPSPAA